MCRKSTGRTDCKEERKESLKWESFMLLTVLVNRHIEHRNKLDKQLDTWILPLVFDRLNVSGSIADYSR